jgi:multicomponent Na+:H+ antiporter subunit G
MRQVIAIVLLGLGVAMAVWSAVGFVRSRDSFVRLHYMSPITTLATFAVALAVAIGEPGGGAAVKAAIVFIATAVTGPVTQHKIGRALWVRRNGGWRLPE